MLRNVRSKKELLIISVIFTAFFYMLGNSYRFFSPMLSGDSLLMVHHNDSAWQISLGRFVHPLLVFLRGGIITPFMLSVLAILWISLSVYFLTDFLKIEKVISIAFVAVVMSCNITILSINTSFVHCIDFYTLALLLAVLGTWLLGKGKNIYTFWGIVSLSLSMGIYQSYICVAIGMVMLYFLLYMTERHSFKKTFTDIMKYVLSFAMAAVLYLILWKIMQKIFNVWTADTYNGLASLGDYSRISVWEILLKTYYNVFYHLWNPETFTVIPFRGVPMSIVWVWMIRFCNVTLVMVLIFVLIYENMKCKTALWQKLFQILILVMMPMGINFVCFLSKGMEHSLMIYAFCLVYIAGIKAVERYAPEKERVMERNLKCCLSWISVMLALVVVCWSNIVYFNQVYMKKSLQDSAAQSLMSRIVHDIESMDGYVAGETPVAFWGGFERTDYTKHIENFEDLLPYGMGKTALLYESTEYAYLKYMMNVNMNLTRIAGDNETAIQMPTYPNKGSVAYVDGVIVVKISE